jgi:hypothetical protein
MYLFESNAEKMDSQNMDLCSNDCVNKHAYRLLHKTHIRFFRSTMISYKRKTEEGSTPLDVMERAAKLVRITKE